MGRATMTVPMLKQHDEIYCRDTHGNPGVSVGMQLFSLLIDLLCDNATPLRKIYRTD